MMIIIRRLGLDIFWEFKGCMRCSARCWLKNLVLAL
ncbi:hypothetical protein LINGRAHAP2_LOCUS9631 [Linum grandiflorum]